MKATKVSLFSAVVVLICTACANHSVGPATQSNASAAGRQALQPQSLPAIAAEYRTLRKDTQRDAQQSAIIWRLWRETDRLTVENLVQRTGEIWQRDHETVFHRKLSHTYRRAIEYQTDDLRILHAMPDWQERALLVSPDLLAKLHARQQATHQGGYTVQEYRGTVNGVKWRIVMRTDIALPLSIERRAGHEVERTELVAAHTLASAPWQPTPAHGYDVIDFADIGDRESDAILAKVMAEFGAEVHRH